MRFLQIAPVREEVILRKANLSKIVSSSFFAKGLTLSLAVRFSFLSGSCCCKIAEK